MTERDTPVLGRSRPRADRTVEPAAGVGVGRVRVRPIFAWYDLWVGVFVDRQKQRVYVFPVPCFGVVIGWGG